MQELTIRDREIIIAESAMSIFIVAVRAAADSWRPEDVAIAERLLVKLQNERHHNRKLRHHQNAENLDRSF